MKPHAVACSVLLLCYPLTRTLPPPVPFCPAPWLLLSDADHFGPSLDYVKPCSDEDTRQEEIEHNLNLLLQGLASYYEDRL